MSRLGNAVKALKGADVKEKDIPPEEVPKPTRVQEVDLKRDDDALEGVDELVKAIEDVNLVSPQDLINMREAEIKALELNLLAAILRELKR